MNFLILSLNVIWYFSHHHHHTSLCIKNKLRWSEKGTLYLKKPRRRPFEMQIAKCLTITYILQSQLKRNYSMPLKLLYRLDKKETFISIICFTFVPCLYDNVLTMVYTSFLQVTSIICRAYKFKEKSQSMANEHTNTIRAVSILQS